MQNMQSRTDTVGDKTTFNKAAIASIIASIYAMDHSDTIDKYDLAMTVGKEAEQRATEFAKLNTPEEPKKLKTPSLLACYVNGKMRFQSRNHEAVHDYARDKMGDFRNNVWVTPVGSFVDSKAAADVDKRAMRKVHGS